MAEQSPSKKLRNQVKGFLCDVSPIKDSKKPYFDAILQHEGECSKVVAFRPEDHIHFHNAETARSLVTLDDVVVQPSVESSRKTSVFYTHSSKMSCVWKRGETSNSLSARPQCVQLSELLILDTKSKKVNINAKIIQEVRRGNSVVRDGRYLPRTEYTVADTTGYISLTVWCEHNITVGEWYNITNVSVVKFRGKTSLSTTRKTQIVSIPSQGTAVAVQVVPTETIKCDIIGVNIKNIFICPCLHTLEDVTSSSATVYCFSCNTRYKPPAIIMRVSGHLVLKPETGNVVEASIEDEVIRSVLTVKPDASREDIIQSFIALPPMQITIRENIVVKMEDVPQKAEVKSEAELPVKVEPMEESIDFYSPPDHVPPMQITIRENIVVKMEDVPQKAEVKSEGELPVKVEPMEESIDFYSPPDHVPPMQITIRENIVVKMEDVPQKAEVKSEAELPVKVEPMEESIDFYSPPDHGILFSSQGRKRKSTD